MKNPGKIIATLLLGAVSTLYGALDATVDQSRVTMGDSVTFTVKATGNDVERPSVAQLCGTRVESTAEGVNMQQINGVFTKAYSYAYTFTPLKDCTIEPLELRVDGVKERTPAIEIRVVPMALTKDAPFILAMHAQKQKVRVGEPFELVVTFKQRHGSQVLDSKFEPPQFKDFWIKDERQSKRTEEGDYSVTRVHYILAAQKSGTIALEPAQIQIASRVASRNSWGQILPQLKWRSYFSNPLQIEVDPLPQGVTLVGSFTIKATADKTRIGANEAVNVSVDIKGSGNFEDIGSLKPDIKQVTVFDEAPKITGYVEQDGYKGSWTQKFALVSDRSFTVPALELTYYDPGEERLKTIRTEPIAIEVEGGTQTPAEPLKILRPEAAEAQGTVTAEPQPSSSWGMFALGVLCGAAAMLSVLLPWRRWLGDRTQRRNDLGDPKTLLMRLLPYRDDPEIAEAVDALEASLYGGGTPPDAKKLKALLKRIASTSTPR